MILSTIPGLVLAVLAAMLAVMAVGWAFQRQVRNGGWTDVFWTYGTGATLSVAALWPTAPGAAPTARQMLVAALAAIWAIRLGTYVALRVAGHPEDARYAGLREQWGAALDRKMLGFLLIQAPASAVLSISVLLAARHHAPSLRLADFTGFAVLAIAIAGEGVADAQMRRFKADPANRGQVMDRGLWAWSRHPNYFFEWLGWLAYPVIALDPARPWTWASFAAPVVMYLLLTRGSGVPPLEQAMLRSKGEAYRAYQARTSAFFPSPPHKESVR